MDKNQHHNLLIFLFFIVINTINGQSNANDYITNIQHFSTEQGLSHRSVRIVYQDREGIMWIGAQNGLNRFDGYNFKHYLGKNHGADLRGIWNIGQDDEGWLWLGTKDGKITFFNPKTEEAKTIEERFGTDCLLLKASKKYIVTKLSDNEGRLYIQIRNRNELYTYHSSEGFKTITTSFKSKINLLKEITDKNELIFFEYRGSGKRWITSKWIVKDNRLHLLNQTEIQDYQEFAVVEKDYKTEQTWKINEEGLCQVFDKNGQLLVFLDDFPITNWQSFFIDNINRAWISTAFGFSIVEIQKNKFQFLAAPTFPDFGTSARGISAENDLMTVVFEWQGIGQYDFQTSRWSVLGKTDWNRPIYQEDENAFWIGSVPALSHWKDNQFQHYTYTPEKDKRAKNSRLSCWVICPSRFNKRQLWLGTESDLIRFDTETKAYQRFEHPDFKTEQLNIQSVIYDRKNKDWLWLCTNKGLFLFDEKKKEFITYYNDNQSDKRFLPSEGFYHLYQEGDVYWLGTIGNGLVRWEREKGTFQQFTIKDGLANDVIYAVYPDDYDNLWMSSDYGIIKMNSKTFSVKNFSLKNGIGQSEFNRTSHFEYRNKNGHQRLFFGGLGGVTTFYPKDFQQEKNLIKPRLALLKYQQFSGSKQIAIDKTLEIRETNEIVIPPNDYIYELEVGLLNYDDVDNNQYLYQLNGGDWQVQRKQLIQLGQLPYGSHQLHIKAKTINNTPSSNILEYTIIVKRPFYLTWWFIVLASIGILGFGFYWYRRRTEQFKTRQIELEKLVKERTAKIEEDKEIIEKQAEKLQELDAVKSRFFANVSHELRTPLTLILGPINTTLKRGDLTNRDFTMLMKAKRSGKNLLKLVGSILDLSKMESDKMELFETPTLLFPFVRRIVSAFESHAQRAGIHFNFEYHAVENLQLQLDKEKLEVILNNLLSNAIKFTQKDGEITVNIEDNENQIKIAVIDTGRGIASEDLPNVFNRFYQTEKRSARTEGGTGIGLALSREFANLMGGKIWVESEWTIGSKFYIALPRKEVLGMVEMPEMEEKLIIEETVKPISLSKSAKQILVVEDNYSLRDYIETILEPYYKIIIAENGKVAYDLLLQNNKENKQQPDFILSDIMMPEMDGYELLTLLKSTDYLKTIPVIMLTARADIQDKLEALRIGVDDYMLKPFDEEELLTRISNLLANYEERQVFLQTENESVVIIENETLVSDDDQEWLQNIEELIVKEMNNSIFSNDYLAEILLVSPKTLYRKIKGLTGLTPIRYIRAIRLQQAKILLENGKSVKQTAYAVGFQQVDYFSKLFKKEFGKSPSEYK